MKRFIFLFFILLSCKPNAFSQAKDSTHNLSFSLNLIQCPINEFSLYADYSINKRSSFGFNFGYIYANPKLKVFILSRDQGTYPGTVWNGLVFRADYKRANKYADNKFWEVQAIYKILNYRNQGFDNVEDDESYFFKRNENAWLLGLDAINGRHLTKPESIFNSEIFWGLGFRYRVRNFTTLSSRFNVPPVGSFQLQQFYPTIIFGLKIGFNVFIKK